MCAICGIVKKREQANSLLVKQMIQAMNYRGPDEEGYWIKDNVAFGHCRLSIIDLFTGKQPLTNEDETIRFIGNGEVYNFRELRKSLENKGHVFSSKSDNEVIVHLYEEKGPDCVKEIRGMFAFAIWDEKEKQLFIARDRIGKKPLVYSVINGNIIFASEIKSLLLNPEVKKEISLSAVDLFLTYQAIPSPVTIFKYIKKLQPAHYLLWKNGEIKIEKYWDVDFSRKIHLGCEEEYEELMWEKLKESVRIRMVSDVPLGVFLSGGIDSSAIVGIMSQLSARPIKTFSVGFNEKDYTELKYAKIVADHFSTEHHQFMVQPDIISILPKLVRHYNEPFGDPSMVPTYYVAQQTKKQVTVALNGDGGDESFAGYPRYLEVKLLEKIFASYKKIPPFLGKNILGYLSKGYDKFPRNTFFRAWRWLKEAELYGFGYAYTRRLVAFSGEHKNYLYSSFMKEGLKDTDAFSLSEEIWAASGSVDLLEKMLYSDFHFYLPEVLMVKTDIATMANALEGRSPFLDHEFIETIASFPGELKLKGRISKYILRKKLEGFLPPEILKRKKMGFGIPLEVWFRNELKDYVKEVLLSEKFSSLPYFNHKYVQKILTEHTSGAANHTNRLWLLLNFGLWHRMFIDGEII